MEVKVDQFVEGWVNFIRSKRPRMLSDEMKSLSEDRSKICNDCDSLKHHERKIGTRIVSRYKCNECGCSFPMMTFSKRKKCPIGKW